MDTLNNIINKIEGIAPLIQVFDMPSSLHFYRDVVGFRIRESSGEGDDVDWVLLELNGALFMMNTAYEKEHRPTQPDPARIATHSDLTLYFGHPDIDALYQYFLDKGISLKAPQITGYGWKAIYIYDPDNYGLCFHWPLDK